MQDYGFQTVAVRASKDDIRRWRKEAKAVSQKLGDYLKGKIDGSFVATTDRANEHTKHIIGQSSQE